MLSTIARPYAKAIFDLALADKTLDSWSKALTVMHQSFDNKQIKDLISNPMIDREHLVGLFEEIIEKAGNPNSSDGIKTKRNIKKSEQLVFDQIHNFLMLLAQNNRLAVLPYIHERFEEMKKEHEKALDVHAITAFEMSKEEHSKISELLKSKFNKTINLQTSVESSLIGGVYLKIGDQVFDASIKAKIEAMRLSLKV